MNLIFFSGLTILLFITFSFIFIGLLMIFFILVKKIFKMNEDKWNLFCQFSNCKGLYYTLFACYGLAILILFPISKFFFSTIGISNSSLPALIISIVLFIGGIIKSNKVKNLIQKKFNSFFIK